MALCTTGESQRAGNAAGLTAQTRKLISARRAAREKCLDCRETLTEITNCEFGPESHDPCPLHFIRYGPSKRDRRGSTMKAIRRYCLWCMNDQAPLVRECDQEDTCPLWPFRMGHRPK